MLKQITIYSTLRCDLKCEHCLRGFPKERPDFPLALLDRLLTEALPFGAKHIAITGGEPHMHPEFDAMIERIVAYGYTWHFVTHGQRIEPYLPLMEKYREMVSHVTVSIDGANAETHDDVRQRKGAFEKVVTSAKEYVRLGYKVRVSASLNKKNMQQVKDLLELAHEIGAFGINFAGTISTAWNTHLVLSEKESTELYQQIQKISKVSDIHIRLLSSLYTRGGVSFCNVLNLSELTFNSRGEMIFCCDTDGAGSIIGSLHNHTLAELVKLWLKQSSEIQSLRTAHIADGSIWEKFDTCEFCKSYFSQRS